MKFSTLFLGALCTCSLLCSTITAATETRLNEIKVVAPRPTVPCVTPLSTQPLSSGYFYTDSADALRSAPGISGGRFGGHGLELVVRGQSQNQLNIIADDAYTFGACPNRMDPPTAYLNLESYQSIALSRGYATVLNGPGASGGAIVLKRKAPVLSESFDTKTRLTGGYDANSNALSSGLGLTLGTDAIYTRFNGAFKHAGNYQDGNNNDVRSSFKERSGSLELGLTPTNKHHYISYDIHRIDDSLFPGAGMDSPLSESQTLRVGSRYSHVSEHIDSLDISAYNSQVDHIMDNYSLRPAGAMLARVDSNSDTYGAKLKTVFNYGDQPFKTTLEYRQNNRDANRFRGTSPNAVTSLQSVMWPDINASEIGIGAETNIDLSNASRLILGGRYDFVSVDYGRADQTATAISMSANDVYDHFYGVRASHRTEHNLGGLLRYERDLSQTWSWFTGLSRSVRTADATERGLANWMVMMGNNRSWVGNPTIAPEKHHQLDIGVIADGSSWHLGANAYINQVNDYILRDSARSQEGILVTAPDADVYRNVDALLFGIEVDSSVALTPKLKLESDATYTQGENTQNNNVLPQIPPLQGHLGLTWTPQSRWSLGSTLRWATEQTRVDLDPTTGTGRDVTSTDGYAIVDATMTVRPRNDLSIKWGISNLFNTQYANHLNRSNIADATEIQVNEPGRSVFVLVTIRR